MLPSSPAANVVFAATAALAAAVPAAAVPAAAQFGDRTPVLEPTRVAEDAAVRFLDRATYGSTPAGTRRLSADGYEAWLDGQLSAPATLMLPRMVQFGCAPDQPGQSFLTCPNYDANPHALFLRGLWWEHALTAPDQLRQRMAFALSEIMVVSDRDAVLENFPNLLSDYYDMLAEGAFGTYRDLLKDVTLHPAMGAYLSMAKNRKADAVFGTRPDENFAREVMQLFSIGLSELNADGSLRLDGAGQPIPTYDQSTITEMARALTGWNYDRGLPPNGSLFDFLVAYPRIGEMVAWPAFHDTDSKVLVGGVPAPAGLTPEQDLALVLDLLADHDNVGPFLGKQLIQRLVTSNPTPEYVARISAVWADDGQGVRGNLDAVVRAILLDPEALDGHETLPNRFGKLREPALKVTAVWRKFEADGTDTALGLLADELLGQRALGSPSVFNFFSPSYASSALAAQRLVAPELEITTHSRITRTGNLLTYLVYFGNADLVEDDWTEPIIDVSSVRAVSGQVARLIQRLDVRMTGGAMADTTRDALMAHLEQVPYTVPGYADGILRVAEAMSLIAISPDFAVQR